MTFDIELVGKIGSMALIDREDGIIDYTRVARLSRELRPGYIWVSSGATEIGRLDHLSRGGKELTGENAKRTHGRKRQDGLCRAGAGDPHADLPPVHRPRLFGAAGARRARAFQRREKERASKIAAPSLPRAERRPHRQLQRPRLQRGEQAHGDRDAAGTSSRASTTTRRLPASPAS